jgi:serine/threonine-protein kinase HipA
MLFKSQVVFWVLGAIDGHAKNFSIRLAPAGRFRLTPLYDVVSAQPSLDAAQIRHNQMKLAMAVGKSNHYLVSTIVGRHFIETAAACGIPTQTAKEVMEEIGDLGKSQIDRTLSTLKKDFPTAVAQSISDGAKHRINSLAAR